MDFYSTSSASAVFPDHLVTRVLLIVPDVIVSDEKTDGRSTSHVPIISDKTQLSLYKQIYNISVIMRTTRIAVIMGVGSTLMFGGGGHLGYLPGEKSI